MEKGCGIVEKEQHKPMEQEKHPLVEPKARENVKVIVFVGVVALIGCLIKIFY
jgi:hypothetical protein